MTKNLAYEMAKILTEYSSPVQPGEYVTHPRQSLHLRAADRGAV